MTVKSDWKEKEKSVTDVELARRYFPVGLTQQTGGL